VGRQIAVAAAAAWLILLAALFIYYQFGPFVIENRAPGILASSLAVLFILLACSAFGLKVLGERHVSLAGCLQGLAVGLAILGVAGFAAGAAGILSRYLVFALAAVLLAVSYRRALDILAALGRAGAARLGPIEAAFLALMAVALIIGFINCVSPVTANDSLVYHFNLPKIYCEQGGMAYLPYNVYANMPHYGEMIFTMFYCAAGETGVALFCFALLISAPLALLSLVTRAAPRVFGLLAASAFLVQPLVLDHRVVGNIDILLAFVYLAAVGMVLERRSGRAALRSSIVVSALAGFMMGVKYTGIAPALSLFGLAALLNRKSFPLRYLALGLAVAAAVFMPWFVRQGLNTGNPVYPMLEGRLDGANWDEVQQGRLLTWQRAMGMGRGPGEYLALPFNVSVRGRPGLNYARFDGTISPVFLILLPLVLVRRRKRTLAPAIAGLALGAFWAMTSQQLRFLMPALALFALAGAAGLAEAAGEGGARGGSDAGDGNDGRNAAERRPRKRWVTFVLVAVLFVEVATLAAPNQYGRPWVGDAVGERLAAALGLEPRERFLERTIQPFSLYKQLNAVLPTGEAVFMIWENRAYHLDRPYLADSFFEASTVMRIVAGARDARDLRDRIAAMGFNYVLVNDLLGEVFARQYRGADIARLRELIDSYLEPVHSANRVTLYRIRNDREEGE
jgi:hypothetical protein